MGLRRLLRRDTSSIATADTLSVAPSIGSWEALVGTAGWEGVSELLTYQAALAIRGSQDSEQRASFLRIWMGIPEGTGIKISPISGGSDLDSSLRSVWRRPYSERLPIGVQGFSSKLTWDGDRTNSGHSLVKPYFTVPDHHPYSAFRRPFGDPTLEVSPPYLSFTILSKTFTERLVAMHVGESGNPLFQLEVSPPEISE